MNDGYTASVPCRSCGRYNRVRLPVDPASELDCDNCGAPICRAKLAGVVEAVERFEADEVQQAAIRRIQDAVDRGEDPFPDEKDD